MTSFAFDFRPPQEFLTHKPSLYLCEAGLEDCDEPNIFAGLTDDQRMGILKLGTMRRIDADQAVFHQGDPHHGIYVILSGIVRVYYTSPSGREITLAYWSPGNFVGGPQLFGETRHMWSGVSARPTEVLALRGTDLRQLMNDIPAFAVQLVEALVHKGKCYSALIHMLGTRSVTERLAQLFLTMAHLDGTRSRAGLPLGRPLTHEELAKMVGSTRQWVSMTFERFRARGLIDVRRHRIVICNEDGLRELAG